MTFTTEQQRCINHLHGDLIVSAAAGSGKTAVLTERIIELVRTRRAGVDELLVVTFTRAAALELTHRIRARLIAARNDADGDEASYLSRQIELLGMAQIGTMHAFCGRLLRRHFGAAGLDPAFRVADETESAALMVEAAEEALEAAAGEESAAFFELFDCYGGRDGTALVGLVQRLYAFTRSQADIGAYLAKALAAYNALSPEAAEALLSEAKRLLSRARQALQQARAAIVGLSDAPVAVLDDDMLRLNALRLVLGRADIDEFKRHLDEHRFLRMEFPNKKAGFPEDAKAEAQALRERAKDCFKALAALFPHTLEAEKEALAASRPAIEALFALLEIFTGIYEEKKAARGVVDFGDLEHRTLAALSDEAVAKEYQARFKYVFMDEYQDTNRVQNALLARLSRDNLFLVGDVKQSIYRFRLAEAELFMERYERGGESGRAHLPHNFRSGKNVVEAVNVVFSRIMTRSLGGVSYEGENRLLATREEDGPAAEFHFFDHSAEADDELEAAEREAVFAAKYISERVGKPLYPGGEPLKYSDCAVLLRSTREAALIWARRFSLEGVPVRADAIGGIFGAVEVRVFRNLLRAIDNRRLDIPLLSAMRVLFAFTDAELATIRLSKGESVYDDVLATAADEGALAEKCQKLIQSLGRWKLDARLMPVDELIGHLFTETGYLSVVAALPGGERRRSNLLTLKEHARANNPPSLFAFLRFLENVERAKRPLPGQVSGELEAVRIMSIHRSKGLEFPLVIVAGLGKRFNFTDVNQSVQLSNMGVAVKHVDVRQGISLDTLTKNAFKARERRETISEEMRILYVAMTRARDALVCCGTARDMKKLSEKARYDAPEDALCPLEWLLQTFSSQFDANRLRSVLHTRAPQPSERSIEADEAFERFREDAQSADTSEVGRAFAFEYPYARAAEAPSKLSVSELLSPDELTLSPPAFLAEPTAADVGTLAHDILMRVELSGDCGEAELSALLHSLESAQSARPETLARVDIKSIEGFLHSPLGLRMRGSEKIERESRFQLFIPGSMAGAAYEGESVLLQGVIDCCFIEDGAWVLLDYKTDYVSDGNYTVAAQKHFRQIELYAYALETLTGLRVTERYIHFLRHGESVKI